MGAAATKQHEVDHRCVLPDRDNTVEQWGEFATRLRPARIRQLRQVHAGTRRASPLRLSRRSSA